MNDIDPQEFGRLVGAVESLTAQVSHMSLELDKISNDLSRGKGIMAGLLIAAGSIGAGTTHLIEKIFK